MGDGMTTVVGATRFEKAMYWFRMVVGSLLIVVGVVAYWKPVWRESLFPLYLLSFTLPFGREKEKPLTEKEKLAMMRDRGLYASDSDERNLRNLRAYGSRIGVAALCVAGGGILVLVLCGMFLK
jgi:hypothetical protein